MEKAISAASKIWIQMLRSCLCFPFFIFNHPEIKSRFLSNCFKIWKPGINFTELQISCVAMNFVSQSPEITHQEWAFASLHVMHILKSNYWMEFRPPIKQKFTRIMQTYFHHRSICKDISFWKKFPNRVLKFWSQLFVLKFKSALTTFPSTDSPCTNEII